MLKYFDAPEPIGDQEAENFNNQKSPESINHNLSKAKVLSSSETVDKKTQSRITKVTLKKTNENWIKTAIIVRPPENLEGKELPPIYLAIGLFMTSGMGKKYACSMAEEGHMVYFIDYHDDFIGCTKEKIFRNRIEKAFKKPQFRPNTLAKALTPEIIKKLGIAGQEFWELASQKGINLHGYSRGAVNIVQLAKKIIEEKHPLKINGILIENPAGIESQHLYLVLENIIKTIKNFLRDIDKDILNDSIDGTINTPHPLAIMADMLVVNQSILEIIRRLQKEHNIQTIIMQNQWDSLFNCDRQKDIVGDEFPIITVHGKNGHTNLVRNPAKDQQSRTDIFKSFVASKEEKENILNEIEKKLKKIPYTRECTELEKSNKIKKTIVYLTDKIAFEIFKLFLGESSIKEHLQFSGRTP